MDDGIKINYISEIMIICFVIIIILLLIVSSCHIQTISKLIQERIYLQEQIEKHENKKIGQRMKRNGVLWCYKVEDGSYWFIDKKGILCEMKELP